MEAATVLAFMGSKSAAKNMFPGQVVVFSIGSIAISTIILLNIGPKVAEVSASAAPFLLNAGPRVAAISAAAAPVAIFLGCAAILGGAVLMTRAAKRPGGRIAGVIAGGALSLVGAGATIGAVVVGISVAG